MRHIIQKCIVYMKSIHIGPHQVWWTPYLIGSAITGYYDNVIETRDCIAVQPPQWGEPKEKFIFKFDETETRKFSDKPCTIFISDSEYEYIAKDVSVLFLISYPLAVGHALYRMPHSPKSHRPKHVYRLPNQNMDDMVTVSDFYGQQGVEAIGWKKDLYMEFVDTNKVKRR